MWTDEFMIGLYLGVCSTVGLFILAYIANYIWEKTEYKRYLLEKKKLKKHFKVVK